MSDKLDATDMDMIRRGDMLGTSQGARVAAYIERLERERDERAIWAKEWHHTIETLATIHGLGILDRDEVIPAFGRYVDGLKDRTHVAEARVARLTEALMRIAEGNLGDYPWQANYDKIRETARLALNHTDGDA